jgi:hypothetical protein
MTDAAIPADVPAVAPVAPVAEVPDHRTSKVRAVFAGLLGVLAIIALVASVVTVWAKNTVFDSKKVASAVDAALQDPAVTSAAGVYLTEQIFTAVDMNSIVTDVLPGPLDKLAPAIVGGVQSRVEVIMGDLLARPKVRGLVVEIVERAHARLMRVLKGDGLMNGVTIKGGKVSVNLLPLIGLGLDQIHNLGLLTGVTLPAFTIDGDPAVQIAALSTALHRDLPADFGQLVVYQSDKLANADETVAMAQQALVLAKRAMYLILALTVVLLVATVVVANRRRRALAVLGLAAAVTFLITRVALHRAVAKIPAFLVKPGAKAAALNTVTSLASGLLTMATVIAIVGLVLAVGLWITGSGARAASLRSAAGSAGSSAGGKLVQYGDVAALALGVLAVVIILVAGLGLWQLIVAGLLAAGAAWIHWGPGAPTDAADPPAA